MAQIHTEQSFEAAIEAHLLGNGYLQGHRSDYSLDLALDTAHLLAVIKATQPKNWAKLSRLHGDGQVEENFLTRVAKVLDSDGTLNVLRHGVTDLGVHFTLAYFKPAHALAPDLVALYEQNRLSLTRQLRYSRKHANEIDLTLFVNGIPVATAELKNPLTGQGVKNAVTQYKKDRDPRDLLLSFKKRCVVHFAVDPDIVYMTTRLAGDQTEFLPFNLGRGSGVHRGAGNPDNPEGHRTAYLWERVWQRDAWLDILGRFICIQKSDAPGGQESVIFPRYHQLDCTTRIEADVRERGAGQRYLVQHSAGSGKSNTIAWLSHGLYRLHAADDTKIFDSIVVVTDRRILDRQLQDTIFQFEQKHGVVQRIDQDSNQLARALAAGQSIIITTIQKFPFALDKVAGLKSRRFCVIIDEAHSSQTGEAAMKLRKVLASGEADEDVTEEVDDGFEDKLGDAALLARPNLTFIALTATPKSRTVEIFGSKDEEGKPRAFHVYSMRQAIEEGFILDVLRNYTTYQSYWRLERDARQGDPEVEAHAANKAIARFVSLHPHNIAQKVEVIIEHFRRFSQSKMGGKAKAMVVTRSRLHAVRFKRTIDAYLTEKGYSDLRALVAFSGTVDDGGVDQTEAGMNTFPEGQTADQFAGEEYAVLIVAEKYQTGFDQPLLHSMYVDKRLDGVKAVQTLSRLNRIYPGKSDTFVLDFVNEPETIKEAFRPYYDETELEAPTDPNLLYDVKKDLDASGVYWPSEVQGAYSAVNALGSKISVANAALNAAVDPGVTRFEGLDEKMQEAFRAQLTAYTRLYSFLTHILPFADVGLTRLYEYGRALLRKLPKRGQGDTFQVDDLVDLRYYRLAKTGEHNLSLRNDTDATTIIGATAVGTGGYEPVKKHLSDLVHLLNEKFGLDLTEADQLTFEQWEHRLVDDTFLAAQAKANDLAHFGVVFPAALDDVVIEQLLQDQRIAQLVNDDPEFKAAIVAALMERVYRQQRGEVTR